MEPKHTFRPEGLHDLSQEQEIDPAETKAHWQPNRERIEELLQAQAVRMKLPKVYYSLQDPELQALLPQEATFEESLIERYDVFALDDGTVRMRITPKEADPFIVTIDGQGVKGPAELLPVFLRVTAKQAGPGQYARASVRAVMGNNEEALPDTRAPFRAIEDFGARDAA